MSLPKLGIQSWCFRECKTTDALINGLKQCGVDNVELCGVHIDMNAPEETYNKLKDSGISVNAFGVNGFSKDQEPAARKVFEFAVIAGFPAISADFHPNALEMLEKLCLEYGKKLAVHNHGRHHRWGMVWTLEELFQRTSENIGLCLDTAWMLDSGENPVEIAEKFKSRLYGTHIKDFVFDRAGRPEDVVVGTGNLNLKEYMAFLKRMNYKGYLTLEYEGDASNPVPAISQCIEAIRKS